MAVLDPVMPQGGGPEPQADSWSADAWINDVGQIRETYGLVGHGQTVVVIDSGIAYDHYALGGGFGSSYRVVGGWDFAENDADPYDDDPAGFHGTHVAGIIASSDEQHLGVAAGVDLVALRVFDDQGESNFDWIEQALVWVGEHQHAFEHPITTVNMSLGSTLTDVNADNWTALEDNLAQLEANGIFVAVSAGNHFEGTLDLTYPAASEHVVPVASVGADGALSAFSQRNDRVLSAPGELITSTAPDYLFGFDGVTDDFVSVSGTSAAAPHVAGASVLVREALEFAGHTDVTQEDIYQHLRATSDIVYDAVTDADYLRVNLSRAIDHALPTDIHGDSETDATNLGNLSSVRHVDSAIERIGDVDYFSLVPQHSGTVTIDVTSDQLGTLRIEGQGSASTSGSLEFEVTAGERLRFGISSNVGIGHYSAIATLVERDSAAPPGIPGESFSESHLRWIPTQTGMYQIDLSFSRPELVTEAILFDGSQAAIFATADPRATEQFVLSVDRIQAYEVVVRGHDTTASFVAHAIGASMPRDGGSVDGTIDLAAVNADQAISRLPQSATLAAIRAIADSRLPRTYVEEELDRLFAELNRSDPVSADMPKEELHRASNASVDVVMAPASQEEESIPKAERNCPGIDIVFAEDDLPLL